MREKEGEGEMQIIHVESGVYFRQCANIMVMHIIEIKKRDLCKLK